MNRKTLFCVAGSLLFLWLTPDNSCGQPAGAKKDAEKPSIKSATAGMKKQEGFIPFYWDEKRGKLFLEIDKLDHEFLYVDALVQGVGSNDLGLDRGRLGDSRIVYFRRVGPKVLLVQPNYDFRALSGDSAEKAAVQQSFAQSILWGFTVAAEDSGKVLVDATDFLLRDSAGIADQLKKAKEGNFKLDLSRSAFFPERTKNFPKNTEVEVTLTFTGQPEGKFLRSVVPSPDSVTVQLRHSFIELPPVGYRPRRFHPQCGFFSVSFTDCTAPLGMPLETRYIVRHRLQKKDPSAPVSEPVKPIIYYVDRGAPEPMRTALLEGARWWSDAFAAAGFKDAYRVELLPEGADPMDVRFNVIQWVHRSTRGWSYGNSIVDPRTGEIICGRVTLGSLRVRQDVLIAEGLLAPFGNGQTTSEEAKQMALARLRQLSAHEVGHTLGLAHNFAASHHGNGSVMDYPHPQIQLTSDGKIDLSQAYDKGIGAWDKVAIAYGYSEFKSEDEEKQLVAILAAARKNGLEFISDADARPAGGAHPRAHLWDNGKSALDELASIIKLRGIALGEFGERNLPPGMPLALLEERLAPIYLLHRYQVEAAAKILGGVDYRYAVRGEDDAKTVAVPAKQQEKALTVLLKTIQPEFLAIPEKLLQTIPPRPPGFSKNREMFPGKSGPVFDPVSAAAAAADHTLSLILHPQRCTRLVVQQARDSGQLGLSTVLDAILEKGWKEPTENAYHDEIARAVDNVILYRLLALATDKEAADQVKSMARWKVQKLQSDLEKRLAQYSTAKQASDETLAHIVHTLLQIRQFEEHPDRFSLQRPPQLPPGMPIGACSCCN